MREEREIPKQYLYLGLGALGLVLFAAWALFPSGASSPGKPAQDKMASSKESARQTSTQKAFFSWDQASEQAAAPAGPADPWDLCGLGRMPTSADGADQNLDFGRSFEQLPEHIGKVALVAAREQLVTQLQSGQPRERVAAQLLNTPAQDKPEAQEKWASQLLEQANSSKDPLSLTWAEAACQYVADGHGCRMQLIQQRLQLEPDNALHWMALADESPEEQERIFKGLQQAKYWRESPQALMLTVQKAWPTQQAAYLRSAVMPEIMGAQGNLPVTGLDWLQEQCANGQNAQMCNDIATLAIQKGDSLRSLEHGRKFAQHIGWTPQMLQPVERQVESLVNSPGHWKWDPKQVFSCNSIKSLDNYVQQFASRNEREVLLAAAITR